MSKLGRIVKESRLKKGYSSEEYAKKLGISESYLHHIEEGHRIPIHFNNKTITKLAKATGMKLADLEKIAFKDDEKKTPQIQYRPDGYKYYKGDPNPIGPR